MSTWFTADQHFGHSHITKDEGKNLAGWKREFENGEQMDAHIISCWNSVIQPTDTVYQLGDFTLARGKIAATYLARLNGHIKFVPGGHDLKWLKDFKFKQNQTGFLPPPFDNHEVLPMLYFLHTRTIPGLAQQIDPETLKRIKKLIVLCHYPLWTWEQSHYGSWHLHGHSHCNKGKNNPAASELLLRPSAKSIDVGADCWDYYPVHLATVIDKLGAKSDETPDSA